MTKEERNEILDAIDLVCGECNYVDAGDCEICRVRELADRLHDIDKEW